MSILPTDAAQQPGATETPISDPSQQPVPGNSQGPEVMPEWANQFMQGVDARIARAEKIASGKQSEADKARAALNKQVKRDYEKEIDSIVATARHTLQLDDAQAAAYRRELVQAEVNRLVLSGEQEPAEATSPGSGAVEATNFGTTDIVNSFGLNTNDTDVIQAMANAGDDVFALNKSLAALIVKRAQAPQPTAASTAIAAGGGAIQASVDTDALYIRLEALYKRPSENKAEIASVLTQLRAAGETIN